MAAMTEVPVIGALSSEQLAPHNSCSAPTPFPTTPIATQIRGAFERSQFLLPFSFLLAAEKRKENKRHTHVVFAYECIKMCLSGYLCSL